MDNLKEIVDKIVIQTGLSKDEIYKLIAEHKEKLGDLVTEVGAAHIVAKDLNVDLSSKEEIEKALPAITQIKDLIPNLNNVTILGRIISIYNEYSFPSKREKEEGILQSLIVEDRTGKIRVVCWDQKVDDLKGSNAKIGDPIRIIGGYTKEGRSGEIELHVGNRGYIQVRPSDINEMDLPPYRTNACKINMIKGNERDISILGKITKKDEEIYNFQRKDGTEGYKLTVIIGDETGEVVVNCWNLLAREIAHLSIGDTVYLNGLNAKIRGDGKIELQTTRISKMFKLDTKEKINVKKELIQVKNYENIDFSPLITIKEPNKMISTRGIITAIMPIKEFKRKDGTEGYVRNIMLSDGKAEIRVVLWDENAKKITEGDLYKKLTIIGGYSKKNENFGLEIYCGRQSSVITEDINSQTFDELDIQFITIDKISDETETANLRGVITNLEPIREIQTKDGEKVELQAINLSDSTGTIRVTCWRTNIKKLANLQENDFVEIINAKVKIDENYPPSLIITNGTIITKKENREGEIVGFVSGSQIVEIESSKEKITDIGDIKQGEKVTVEGTVIHLYERPFIYNLCPECGKKISMNEEGQFICSTHNSIKEVDHLLIFNFLINDGTENLNIVCSRKTAEKVLGLETNAAVSLIKENDSDMAPYTYLKSKGFEGKVVRVTGVVRLNKYLNVIEISATKIDFLDYKRGTEELLKTI